MLPTTRRVLLYILLVTLIKIGFTVWLNDAHPERFSNNDTRSYDGPAVCLLEHGRFCELAAEPDRPMYIRTPGYPAMLAAVYGVFGFGHFAAVMANVVLLGVLLWLVYLLGGVWAMVLVSLDPNAVWAAHSVSSETLFSVLLVLAMLFAVKQQGVAFGLALAAATFVRPITCYVLPFIAVGWWLQHRGKWRPLAVASAIFLAAIGAWNLRNLSAVGAFNFSGIVGQNMLLYRAAAIAAEQEGIPFEDAQEKLAASIPATADQGERYRQYSRRGLEIVLGAPVMAVKHFVQGIGATLLAPGRGSFTSQYGPRAGMVVTAYSMLYLALMYGLILKGRAWRKRQYWILWAVAAYLVLAPAGIEANSRFRIPITPFFAVFAASGIAFGKPGRGSEASARAVALN